MRNQVNAVWGVKTLLESSKNFDEIIKSFIFWRFLAIFEGFWASKSCSEGFFRLLMTSTSPKNVTKPIPRGPPLLPTCSPHFLVLFQPFLGIFQWFSTIFDGFGALKSGFKAQFYFFLVPHPSERPKTSFWPKFRWKNRAETSKTPKSQEITSDFAPNLVGFTVQVYP